MQKDFTRTFKSWILKKLQFIPTDKQTVTVGLRVCFEDDPEYLNHVVCLNKQCIYSDPSGLSCNAKKILIGAKGCKTFAPKDGKHGEFPLA